MYLHIFNSGKNIDFNSATQNVITTAGTNSSTVNIAVINDNIVEGDEMFTINLNVPVSPGIVAGAITMATATIIDTSSKLDQYLLVHSNAPILILLRGILASLD